MKMHLFPVLLGLMMFSFSCKNDSTVRQDAQNSLNQPGVNAANPAMPATSPATAASGAPHYVCPNNCAGSGGPNQANCPVCGTAYTHNQAFHAAEPQTAPAPTTTMPTPAAEPAQNAAGVWHYTCSKGCAGGAGTAVACSSCGNPLAHNTAYHN